MDMEAIAAALSVAAPVGAIFWYKIGRLEQRVQDLPCVHNGIKQYCIINDGK